MSKPKKTSSTLRVNTRVKIAKGPHPWRAGAKIFIVKRSWEGSDYYGHWSYYVVAEGDPPGAGAWLPATRLRVLSPLEELANQAIS